MVHILENSRIEIEYLGILNSIGEEQGVVVPLGNMWDFETFYKFDTCGRVLMKFSVFM